MRDTTAEIELTTGSVVQVFTTDAVGEEFLLAPGGPAGMRALGHGPPRRHKGSARREANKNRMCNTEIFARVLPRGFYDEDGHAIAEGCHGRTEVGTVCHGTPSCVPQIRNRTLRNGGRNSKRSVRTL